MEFFNVVYIYIYIVVKARKLNKNKVLHIISERINNQLRLHLFSQCVTRCFTYAVDYDDSQTGTVERLVRQFWCPTSVRIASVRQDDASWL